jgi:hypothetical protein
MGGEGEIRYQWGVPVSSVLHRYHFVTGTVAVLDGSGGTLYAMLALLLALVLVTLFGWLPVTRTVAWMGRRCVAQALT